MKDASILFALLGQDADTPSTPWVPPTASDPPPGTSTGESVTWPNLIGDDTTLSVRPIDFTSIATIRLSKTGGDASTFQDAVVLASNRQDAYLYSVGRSQATATPNDRVTISVEPGEYTEPVSTVLPPFLSVVASDPTPGKTSIHYGLEVTGGLYWEGVDVVNPDTIPSFDPKYCFHVHAGSTMTFTRCTMTNKATKSGGYPTPIGMDGGQGATLLLHRVTLLSGVYTNLHGWGLGGWSASKPGMTVIFNECSFEGGSFYYDSLNDSTNDELWVQNCTGRAVGLGGKSTTAHVAGSTLDTPPTVTSVQTNQSGVLGKLDSRSDWPVPHGGLSASDRAAYGV